MAAKYSSGEYIVAIDLSIHPSIHPSTLTMEPMEPEKSQQQSKKAFLPVNRIRLASFFVMVSFFAAIFFTVLLPSVSFRPKASGRENSNEATVDGNPRRGRQIYIREGCVYCHSQYVRLQDRGMGPVSMAGDFVNETPHQLGTARTGPDLTNEGKRFANGWQRAHLVNPRSVKPGSIMPSFSYLSNRDLDDLVAYIQTLGNRRRSFDPYEAPQEYDAYLQRKKVDTSDARAAQAGKGLYVQNCSSCHGVQGNGAGTASIALINKPSNFTLPKYSKFSDAYWFFRITEGAPGSGMPRWDTLSEEQRWDLVAYLKTFQKPEDAGKDPQVEQLEMMPLEMRHTHQQWEPPLPDQ